ncbi:MAG: LacI family DNA-binding transcriptional regulator [Chthoniobacteraceae bacterium]
MSPPRRATQKDVALKAGVTQATVSLALSHHPSISAETRARIQAVAAEVGYQPDPYLAGLSAYRKRVTPSQFQATLAWISNYPQGDSWRRFSTFRNYYEGACARAIELGYKIEEHLLCGEGMNFNRMARILKARNISGLLIAPQPRPGMSLDFPFEDFSAVTFGYTLVSPRLHVVTTHHFRVGEIVFRKLMELGYRRPGLALPPADDDRTNRIVSASFWNEQRNLPEADRVPLFSNPQQDRASFLEWFRKHRPDVVIAMQNEILDWLVEAGVSVPEQIGFASLSTINGDHFYSGIWENPHLIGGRAVEYLIDLIHRSECGMPDIPVYLLVEGTWVEGKTVRRVADAS